DVVDALLLRKPTFADKWIIAVPGHLCQIQVGLRLLLRRLELRQRGFCLGDLVIELRRGDLDQKLPLFYPITDVHVALLNVPPGAREDAGGGEGRAGRREPRDRDRVARLDRRHAHTGNEIPALLGNSDGIALPLIMALHPVLAVDLDPPSGRFAPAIVGRNFVHSSPLSNTPWAFLPSLRLRSVANRHGTISSVVGVANSRPPMTARASAAFCSSPAPPIAIGTIPTIMAAAVISTGRMRV